MTYEMWALIPLKLGIKLFSYNEILEIVVGSGIVIGKFTVITFDLLECKGHMNGTNYNWISLNIR